MGAVLTGAGAVYAKPTRGDTMPIPSGVNEAAPGLGGMAGAEVAGSGEVFQDELGFCRMKLLDSLGLGG